MKLCKHKNIILLVQMPGVVVMSNIISGHKISKISGHFQYLQNSFSPFDQTT